MKKYIKNTFQILMFILAAGILMMVGTAFFQIILGGIGKGLTEEQLYSYSGSLGVLIAGIGVAVFTDRKKRSEDLKERSFKFGWRVIPIALAATCVNVILWDSLVGICLNRAFPMESYVSGKSTFLDFIFPVAIAPISEELLFRKGLYGFSRDRLPKIAALLLNAVLFAIIHGYQLQGLLSTFIAGIVLTVIFEKTGNVWYSIITHMVFNLFSVSANALVHRGIGFYTEINGYVIYHWGVVLAAAVFTICFAGICIRNGREKSVQDTCG